MASALLCAEEGGHNPPLLLLCDLYLIALLVYNVVTAYNFTKQKGGFHASTHQLTTIQCPDGNCNEYREHPEDPPSCKS